MPFIAIGIVLAGGMIAGAITRVRVTVNVTPNIEVAAPRISLRKQPRD